MLDPKFQEKIIDILISPNSHMVALQSKDRISLYDSKLGELVGKIEDPQGIVSAIWSPDSLALVVFS